MKDNEIILKVAFFKTLNGKEPVRDWLLSLTEAQKMPENELKTAKKRLQQYRSK